MGLPARHPPVHRWERKFGSENASPKDPKCGTSPRGHTAPRRFTGGSASLGSESTSPKDPKCGTSPLGHIAPRRFTGGSASLGSENASPKDPKCGTSPHGHTAPRRFTGGSASLAARTPPPKTQNAERRPLVTPPPAGSPVGAQVWQRDRLRQQSKMRSFASWPHRPPPVHRWERKFGSEIASANDPKCGASPLGHTATSRKQWGPRQRCL